MTVPAAVAIANQQVAAGYFFQHKGKVFAAGQGLALARDVGGAHQLFAHIAGKVSFGQGVHQDRVAALVIDAGFDTVALGLGVHQLFDAGLEQLAHVAVQRAHAQLHRAGLRNHIIGHPRVEGAHRDHRHVQRVHIARDDGLQGHHNRRARHNGIHRLVRHRAMAAHAFQRDGHVVG